MALPVKNRVRKARDFDKVFSRGQVVRGDFLLIRKLPNDLGYFRFGFVISSKNGKTAVIRNKVQRVLLAKTTHYLDQDGVPAMDIVVLVKRPVIKSQDVNLMVAEYEIMLKRIWQR